MEQDCGHDADLSRRASYGRLGLALILLAVLYPVLEFGVVGLALWTAMFLALLLTVVRALHPPQPWLARLCRALCWATLAAAVAAVVCYGMQADGHGWIFVPLNGLILAYLALATWLIFVDVFASPRVDRNRLVGAACAYVLLGLVWTYAYLLLHGLSSGLVLGQAAVAGDAASLHAEYLYFSFVTLSTLGYGDLVPQTLSFRIVAASEALVGQIYLAILVARIVGMHLFRMRE